MSEAEPASAAVPFKRRWYQYSLRTLMLMPLVLALVLSAIYSWPYVHRRYVLWRLQDYVDRDLRGMPEEEKQRGDKWITTLIGAKSDYCTPQTWLFHTAEIRDTAHRAYVVEIGSPMVGYSHFCEIHNLDSWGRSIFSQWVIFPKMAFPKKVVCSELERGFECMTVVMDDGDCRYYHITDQYVEMLRAELANGKLAIEDMAQYSVHEKPVDWSDWQRLLESRERLQQLRGLAAYFADYYRAKRFDDTMRHRLSELAGSPDPWISEEAKLALKEAEKE